jgi:IclR family transcriptional regulator, acetate operon repressor
MKQGAYPGTRAVLRAIRVLKAFTPEAPERRLLELCRVAGLSKGTAYRLLTALESEGMVERVREAEAWRLGSESLALGSRALAGLDLRSAAQAELRALAEETRETITLEVLVGTDTLILDEAMGGHVVGTLPSVGTRWPAHATSTGKALLAELPAAALEQLLPARLARSTPRTLAQRARLLADLQRVRARGYATSVEELEPGFAAVGAAVRGAGGQAIAAISVGGLRDRVAARLPGLGREAMAAAARISARVGHRDAAVRGQHVPASRKARLA